MFSIPPATCASAIPSWIFMLAMLTAFNPDAQTLLIVVDSTLVPSPANMAAWRAGACPTPPWSTLPIYTSLISSCGTEERSMAALIACEPRTGAGTVVNAPLNYCVVRLQQGAIGIYRDEMTSYHTHWCPYCAYDVCILNLLCTPCGGAKCPAARFARLLTEEYRPRGQGTQRSHRHFRERI